MDKGIKTIIGGFCVHLVIGSIFIWGNIAVYVTSYMRERGGQVTMGSTFILLPLCVLITGPMNFLGTQICMKIGTKKTTALGLSLII